MIQPFNYEAMSQEQLTFIATHNDQLIRLIKRILALPDPAIMTAEEKVEWISFLSELEMPSFLSRFERGKQS